MLSLAGCLILETNWQKLFMSAPLEEQDID